MNEEHQEDSVSEENAVEEGTAAPKRSLGKWTAFIAAILVLSGVATTGVLASNGNSGCPITDAKTAVASLLGMDSGIVLAATNSEDGASTCSKSKRRSAKAASSEDEAENGCKLKGLVAASTEGEAKQCPKAAAALAKAGSGTKSCCKDKLAKAASSEGEARQCDKANAAKCDKEGSKAKAASSEGEAKQCDKANAAKCDKEGSKAKAA
ncbi:MAG: hypothetical protein L3K26_08285, partial [Candidatus Hydrogenedentes bacterium]|nr:hypothetical protein [Candidatus Hydrogenedentota bacterium]